MSKKVYYSGDDIITLDNFPLANTTPEQMKEYMAKLERDASKRVTAVDWDNVEWPMPWYWWV